MDAASPGGLSSLLLSIIAYSLFIFFLQGIKLRALCMLSKGSTTELYLTIPIDD
jgi:hypothetical protein